MQEKVFLVVRGRGGRAGGSRRRRRRRGRRHGRASREQIDRRWTAANPPFFQIHQVVHDTKSNRSFVGNILRLVYDIYNRYVLPEDIRVMVRGAIRRRRFSRGRDRLLKQQDGRCGRFGCGRDGPAGAHGRDAVGDSNAAGGAGAVAAWST